MLEGGEEVLLVTEALAWDTVPPQTETWPWARDEFGDSSD